MKVLTENRLDYIKSLGAITPEFVIAPFGFSFAGVNNLKIICTKAYAESTARLNDTWTVRSNNQIHAKLAIGKYGIVLGSWNFTQTSTKDKHEIGIHIRKGEYLNEYHKALKYFQRLWARSTPIKKEGKQWVSEKD